ncbi:probable phospholipid-transporting ATPase VA, partial [Myotis lucifugus]|uniref:probable phospholipid-transporting ATPase VA n=1 Tax=Myotis lucifugus TaxID=59463 RepID=UPI0003C43732
MWVGNEQACSEKGPRAPAVGGPGRGGAPTPGGTTGLKTTKYTLLSFVPKNLFEQFHRLANVYFVLIALLNFVPAVNAFQPGLALAPVLFILAVTAFKDLWEDYSRHRSDQEINHLGCLVFS